MIKSYKLFILIFLFITQLVGCFAPVAVTGVVAPPLSFADRRSAEVQYIDQRIEFKAIIEIQERNLPHTIIDRSILRSIA